eukprot:5264461-Amphidinium_carterae.1
MSWSSGSNRTEAAQMQMPRLKTTAVPGQVTPAKLVPLDPPSRLSQMVTLIGNSLIPEAECAGQAAALSEGS